MNLYILCQKGERTKTLYQNEELSYFPMKNAHFISLSHCSCIKYQMLYVCVKVFSQKAIHFNFFSCYNYWKENKE